MTKVTEATKATKASVDAAEAELRAKVRWEAIQVRSKAAERACEDKCKETTKAEAAFKIAEAQYYAAIKAEEASKSACEAINTESKWSWHEYNVARALSKATVAALEAEAAEEAEKVEAKRAELVEAEKAEALRRR